MSYSQWFGFIQNHNEQDISKLSELIQFDEEGYHTDGQHHIEPEENLFYIPWDNLTPSEIEGMTELEERKIRIFTTTFLQEAGIHLKLPQATILTGLAIFNRFYWKQSYIKFEPFHIAAASLFLACKVEETLRRIRDVISVFYHLYKKKENKKSELFILDVTTITYQRLKNQIIVMETFILKELGFCLYDLTNHPHKYLLYFIKNLKGNRDFLQKAWNYLNDAYRTSLVVNYPPNVLACSSIFLASRIYNYPLSYGFKWWEVYETTIEEIQEVCAEILNLYEFGKVDLVEIKKIFRDHSPDIVVEEEKPVEQEQEVKIYKEEFVRTKRSRSRSRSRSRHKKKHSKRKRSDSSHYKKKHRKRDSKKKKKRKYSISSSSSSSSSNVYERVRLASPKFDKFK
jgi:transcription initiation factor TFIIIB Brf1 subunit/transcription initiation factor TFIIB